MITMSVMLVILIMSSQVLIHAQYYGYHCGKGAGHPDDPVYDCFDECCYHHDRCLEKHDVSRGFLCEGYNIGLGFKSHGWLRRKGDCHVWVAKCMVDVSNNTGQKIPKEILIGVFKENIG